MKTGLKLNHKYLFPYTISYSSAQGFTVPVAGTVGHWLLEFFWSFCSKLVANGWEDKNTWAVGDKLGQVLGEIWEDNPSVLLCPFRTIIPQQRLVEVHWDSTEGQNTELIIMFSLKQLACQLPLSSAIVGTWISWQLHHWGWEGDPGKDECNPAELPEESWGGPLPAAVTGVWHQTWNPRELPHQWVVVEEGRSVREMLVAAFELQVECTALSHTLPVLWRC